MLSWIFTIIIGALIGAIAGWITKSGGSINWFITIVCGLLGSMLGEFLFGTWGLTIAGMAVFPSILGASILTFVAATLISLFSRNA